MVTIFNKSNRPIGIAGQSVLPDREIKVKDKDAYCFIFDENGVNTGKQELLPGLVAIQKMGFITIREDREEAAEKKDEDKEKAEKKAAAAKKRAETLAKKKAEKEAAQE